MSFSSCKHKFTLKWTIWYHITYHSKSDKASSSYFSAIRRDLSGNRLTGGVPGFLANMDSFFSCKSLKKDTKLVNASVTSANPANLDEIFFSITET
ncbi:hypothetical protein YC2023_051516 [Brassica napus]